MTMKIFIFTAIFLTSIIFLIFASKGENMDQIPGKVITEESIIEMFANIQSNTEWDMSTNMVWGYFFTHNEPKMLEKAAKVLKDQGYNIVDIYMSDKETENDPNLFWLHIEKVEVHTPTSLDKRNNELYIFAHNFGLDSYDGMDVGPIQK